MPCSRCLYLVLPYFTLFYLILPFTTRRLINQCKKN
jgi:hypothetical protein